MNYPALIGGYGAMELSKTMGNRLMALPFTVIVDRQGKVAHTQLGPIKEDQLAKIVGQLL
jgi:peroxiredoxin